METKDMEIFNDHERRIFHLENQMTLINDKMNSFENNQLRFENTLIKEGQETRDLLRNMVSHDQDIEKAKLDFDNRMAEEKRRQRADMQQHKRDILNKFMVSLLGAGGFWAIIFYLVQKYI